MPFLNINRQVKRSWSWHPLSCIYCCKQDESEHVTCLSLAHSVIQVGASAGALLMPKAFLLLFS